MISFFSSIFGPVCATASTIFPNAAGVLVALVVALDGPLSHLFSRWSGSCEVTAKLGLRQATKKTTMKFWEEDPAHIHLAKEAKSSFRADVPWSRWYFGWESPVQIVEGAANRCTRPDFIQISRRVVGANLPGAEVGAHRYYGKARASCPETHRQRRFALFELNAFHSGIAGDNRDKGNAVTGWPELDIGKLQGTGQHDIDRRSGVPNVLL